MAGETLLQAEEVAKSFRGRCVVNRVSLRLNAGEIVGLLGPNGAGKTTTFYMIVGLVRPDAGRILFRDRDVTRQPVYRRARMGMGYLSQEPSIFRKLTVEENILAVIETMGVRKRMRKSRCRELLERLSMQHLAAQKAYTLSGGERRKLEITRALVRNPSMIMLDEPFSGVDPLAVDEIQSIIADLRDSGLGILITDHNVRETLAVVDRAYLLYEGQLLREGSSSFLINDKMSRELYLGHTFTM